MILSRNYYDQIDIPQYILTKANKEVIGEIICIEEKTMKLNLEINEISFKTYKFIDGVKNAVYDEIIEMQYVKVPNIGYFIIESVDETDDALNPSKTVNCKSAECVLGQRYLKEFYINKYDGELDDDGNPIEGQSTSIDDVSLYNLSNPNKSLLHLVLQNDMIQGSEYVYLGDWKIGHIDTELMEMQRSFEVTRQDIYSFLKNDVADAFDAIVIFNSFNYTVNMYKEDSYGKDTNIYVSYNNLLKDVSLSSSIDDIKTCLTVLGSDDINLREVNLGMDKIYNFDYFASDKYMSQGLINAYNSWKQLCNNAKTSYNNLIQTEHSLDEQIIYLKDTKMPDDPETDTDWTKYSLKALESDKLKSYQTTQENLISQHVSEDSSSVEYQTLYVPVLNAISGIQSQITVLAGEGGSYDNIVGGTIGALIDQLDSVKEQKNTISTPCLIENNFTENQIIELCKFIREDEISSENYVITDSMNEAEILDMRKDMLAYGEKELKRVSQPQIQLSSNMSNIFNIPEFKNEYIDFECGNYIYILLRDDYSIKARLIAIEFDFFNLSDIKVEFSNVGKTTGRNIYTDIANALSTSNSVATSVTYNSSSWNSANRKASDISKMIQSGLLSSGEAIKTANSDVIIDNRGIITANKNEEYSNDRIIITGSQIIFSDDNFTTTKTALGRVKYIKNGVQYDDFGLVSQFVMAGYIAGCTIEGNNYIVGGTEDGKIVMYDENGEEKGHWDKDGFVFPPGTKIEWANIEGTDNVVTDENKSEKIDKTYIDGLGIKAASLSVNDLHALGATIGGFDITEKSIEIDGNLTENVNGVSVNKEIKIGMCSDPSQAFAIYSGSKLKNHWTGSEQEVYQVCAGHNGELLCQDLFVMDDDGEFLHYLADGGLMTGGALYSYPLRFGHTYITQQSDAYGNIPLFTTETLGELYLGTDYEWENPDCVQISVSFFDYEKLDGTGNFLPRNFYYWVSKYGNTWYVNTNVPNTQFEIAVHIVGSPVRTQTESR